MAPRPKTYGTRRSHAKQACEPMNGTTADEPEPKLKRNEVVSARLKVGKEKDLETARKEEKPDIPPQSLGKEHESASGTSVELAAPSHAVNVKDKSKFVSLQPGSLQDRRISAQDMLPPDMSIKERSSRRTSISRSVNGSATSENQDLITNMGIESTPIDRISPLHAKAISRPNGFTEDLQQSPIGRDIDLKSTPSDLHDLAIWVARLISKHSNKSPLSAMTEPSQKDSSPQPGQDVEIGDALDSVEGVRMTRGKEKKRLQQLKGNGKEPANDLSGKFVAGVGKLLRPRDAASIETRLKNDLNDELKQNLFGSPNTRDMSTDVIERNACGKLLFNTLVDIEDSANRNSAAVLKSALEARTYDAPFLSALKILASSPAIMAFTNFLFSKDGAPQCEASNADVSRPSIGVETSGATCITEISGVTSRTGISMTDVEASFKVTTRDKAIDNKNLEEQERSQEVIQALEAATTILVQIQQAEAGTDYLIPYASGSMIPNPVAQRHMGTYGSPYGHPYPDHSPYGPPVGASLTNYASPYANPMATHPISYASPYSNPVNQPPAKYASPYAKSVVSNQASGSGFVGSGDNQPNKHDRHEIHHDGKEVHTPHQEVIGAAIEIKKRDDGAAGKDISNEERDASEASTEANDQDVSNEKEETSKACDEANSQGVSKEKGEASNAVDLDATDVDDANKQDSSSEDVDLTDNDLKIAKTQKKNVAPPAENHKLFTGERLGDFTSMENIDWLLTVGNGGKIPRPSKKTKMNSLCTRSSSPSSQADVEVETEVSRIINHIMLYKDWRGHPGGTKKQLFYASAEGQRLASKLKQLMAIAKPVVNEIIPLAESQARLRFCKQLESRAMKEKRDREIQEGINRYYGVPIQMQQWGPPPVGLPVAGFPIPPPLPSNGPMQLPFVRRGNVIAAPPGGRDVEEEKKAETYGYPPKPGSRPGSSPRGQKRKRAARH